MAVCQAPDLFAIECELVFERLDDDEVVAEAVHFREIYMHNANKTRLS
jgi:hypothetical protein